VWGVTSRWMWADVDKGAAHYFSDVLPLLPERSKPLQCMVRKGETMYVP
jgi:hypothetical protein